MSLFQRMDSTSRVGNGKFSLEAFSIEEEDFASGETTATELNDAAAQGEGDITEAAAEAVEVSNDVDVMQEAMYALEDGEEIADVQANVDNATQSDIDNAAALQQTVMERVEGKGNVEDVPATESRVGGKISVEGFKEWIKAAWEKIKEFAGNIYHKIKMLWKRFVNGTGRLLKRVEKLKEKLKGKKSEAKKDSKIKLNLSILALTSSGKFSPKTAYDNLGSVVKGAKELGPGLKDMVKVCKENVEKCKAEAVKDATEADYNKFLESQAEGTFSNLSGGKDFNLDKRFGKLRAKYEATEIGNKAMFICVDTDAATLSTVYTSISIRFETLYRNWNTSTKDNEHSPLSKGECEKVASEIETVAKELQNFFEKDTSTVDKEIGALKDVLDKNVKDSAESPSSFGKEIYKGMQRIYVLPTQALRAAVNVASFYVQVAGAYLTLADVSADKLEDDKKD